MIIKKKSAKKFCCYGKKQQIRKFSWNFRVVPRWCSQKIFRKKNFSSQYLKISSFSFFQNYDPNRTHAHIKTRPEGGSRYELCETKYKVLLENWKIMTPPKISRESILGKFWVYRSLDIYLKKIFKNFFVCINVEGQKFLPEVEGHFSNLLFFVVATKKIHRKFSNWI